MANAKTRLANPVATNTGIVHVPPNHGSAAAAAVGGAEASQNWSGVDEVYSFPAFASNNNGNGSVVYGTLSQPYVGYENCSYGPFAAWSWVGMDGSGDATAGNDDTLQAGFAAQACPTQNYAWYEWWTLGCTVNTPLQPCSEFSVNLPVSPGNILYVSVTYHTSTPNGTAFLENETTGQYISIGYNQPSYCAPPGQYPAYAGYAAEWIVERPELPPTYTPSNLANYYLPNTPYTMQPFYYVYPWTTYIPPGRDTSGTFNIINMYCDIETWNPFTACESQTNISTANYCYPQAPSGKNSGVLYFTVSGPAASQ